MAYHDELLEHARNLIRKKAATQADLRRAVSAAYYSLFHLLISETTLNWSRTSSRHALGRIFDHGLMKRASKRILDSKKSPFIGEDPTVVIELRTVAEAFVQLQERRHIADYDNATSWTAIEALIEVMTAVTAFHTWKTIRNENIAQDYLVSLLIRRD